MKKLIFFITACCLLYSCNNYKYHDLPQDKIPLLTNNDTVCFRDSVSNKVDTFCLNITDKWEQTTEGDYFRYINIYYNEIFRKTIFLRIYIGPSTNITITTIGVYYWLEANEFKTNYTFQGVTYPNVYIRHNNSSDTIPNTVYLTYNKGIIRYEYKDGRVYDLVK